MAAQVLDTGILLRVVRRRPGFDELMERLNRHGELYISAMTRIELVQGMREHERARTLRLMDSLPTYPLDAPTADLAGELILAWRRRGVTLQGPDAAIAATAIRLDATLVTLNARHFPMPELRLLIVDEQGRVARPPTNGGV